VSCFEKELFQVTKPAIDLLGDEEKWHENSTTCSFCLAVTSDENRIVCDCYNSVFHTSCLDLWLWSYAEKSEVFCPAASAVRNAHHLKTERLLRTKMKD